MDLSQGTTETRRTRYLPETRAGHVLKAHADGKELSVTAALTFPGPDLSGDVLHAGGLNFDWHAADPWVDLEHGRHPSVGRARAGWCRKSLDRDADPYAVDYCRVNVRAKGEPPELHDLPFAVTYFDKDDRLQSQCFALYERAALTGVSLEFAPVPGCTKAIGWSDLEDRPAREYARANVVRYALTATPVCEGALVLRDGVVRKALPPSDALAAVLAAGRVGSEELHPTLAKAFAHHRPARRSVVGGYEAKAMDDPNTVYGDPAVTGEPEAPEESAGPPTAEAAYMAAQAFKDAIEAVREKLQASEHVAGKKKILKILDRIEERDCEELLGVGDQVSDDVGKGDDATGALDDETPGVEDGATDTDDDDPDRTMKAFRADRRAWVRPVLKALRARRFTLAEIRKAEAEKPAADPGGSGTELTGDTPEDLAREDRAARKYRRAERIYG